MKELKTKLPEYDFMYLGDNARTPYGNRSYESVYNFTLQGVKKLFSFGCNLVILACNTSSAKALRSIQQRDLPLIDPSKRVLGVIRPSTELIGTISKTRKVGILGTHGTIHSDSYKMEIAKFFPDIEVFQQACPMWVPLVENNEHMYSGADFFVKKYLDLLMEQSPDIDSVILGCTHYPLLIPKIKIYLPESIYLVSQGVIVADRLEDYLLRHAEIEAKCTKNKSVQFYTTDSSDVFDRHATIFYGEAVFSEKIVL